MNWRFTLPFAIVAIAVLAVAGVATLNMENQQIAAQSPVAMEKATANPTQGDAMMAKSNTAAVVSTGDPVEDIVGTVGAEGTGDAAVMSDTSSDASVVNNDSSDLSALSSSYDQAAY